MEVVKIYKTSRGLFETIDLAMLKQNRARIDDLSGPDHGWREEPVPVMALLADGAYYLLNPIDVKATV